MSWFVWSFTLNYFQSRYHFMIDRSLLNRLLVKRFSFWKEEEIKTTTFNNFFWFAFLDMKTKNSSFSKSAFFIFSNETSFGDQFSFFDCSFYVNKVSFLSLGFSLRRIKLFLMLYFIKFLDLLSYFPIFYFFFWLFLIPSMISLDRWMHCLFSLL